MNERAGFLNAICREPWEDTHRLVFADWLEERGESERAMLIRWQIANGVAFWRSPDAPRWRNKAKRGTDMFPNQCWQALNAFLSEFLPGGFRISRGFVSHIELPCESFTLDALALFAANPITSVVLSDRAAIDGTGWSRGTPVVRPRGGALRPRRLTDEQIERASIPSVIFDHLPGIDQYTNWRDFKDAHAVLSDACVAYGRSLAGLPALPTRAPATA